MNSAQGDSDSVQPFRIVLLGFLVLVLVLTLILPQFAYISPEDGDVGKRFFMVTFSVTYENRNSEGEVWNFTEDERRIGLFLNNSWQTVYLMNVSYPIERFEPDEEGNPSAVMSFSKSGISLGESLSYEVAYRVVLKPRSLPEFSENGSESLDYISGDLKSVYCGSAGPWQVKGSGLMELAHEVAGNETNILSIVKRFIVWIKENIRYKSGDVPRYPDETLLGGFGDCDDQANLLIALCRAVGIPAYLQIGCIYIPDRTSETSYWNGSLGIKLSSMGWHGWAMVYVPPWGWLPVDLTFAGGLHTDPLKAVNMSAVIAHPTVQYANIARTDYVAATRNLRDFVTAREFYIYERDVMREETVEERTEEGIISFHFCLVARFLFLSDVHFQPAPRIREFSCSIYGECL